MEFDIASVSIGGACENELEFTLELGFGLLFGFITDGGGADGGVACGAPGGGGGGAVAGCALVNGSLL